ncbi:MAG: hypothetical protein EXR71_07060 [Myxococcales bacterium]|nr:hypothetical protein [Myxococcales bacterium]
MLFLTQLGLAAPLGDHLAHVDRSPAGFAVSCSDGERAWTGFSSVSDMLGSESGGRERWAPIFSAGVPVVSAIDSKTHRYEFAFPTPGSAEAVAAALTADDPTATAVFSPSGWLVRRREEEYRLRVDDGWAHLEIGPTAPDLTVHDAPVALLGALPSEEGCLVVGRLPAEEGEPLAGDFGVHVPLVPGEPIRFALAGASAELASVIPLAPRSPLEVRTRLAPAAVMSVGVAFDRVDMRFFFKGGDLARARALQRLLPITTGVMFAVVGEGPAEMQLAAVLPLAEVDGATLSAEVVARRAARALRAMKLRVERLDKTHFRAQVDEDWFWFAGRPGALYGSTGQAAVSQMEQGNGTSWAGAAFADQAERFPLVLSSWLILDAEDKPQRLGDAVSLALGVHHGVVAGELVLPLTPSELGGLLAMLRKLVEDGE